MGTNTAHTLTVIEGDSSVIAEFVKSDEYIAYAINENGETENDCNWYEHPEDLKEFSKTHPKTVFKLHGEGDEGDFWDAYFKNGKMQVCPVKMTYAPFDVNLLT